MHCFIDLDLRFVLVSGSCSVINCSSVHVTINKSEQDDRKYDRQKNNSMTECMIGRMHDRSKHVKYVKK